MSTHFRDNVNKFTICKVHLIYLQLIGFCFGLLFGSALHLLDTEGGQKFYKDHFPPNTKRHRALRFICSCASTAVYWFFQKRKLFDLDKTCANRQYSNRMTDLLKKMKYYSEEEVVETANLIDSILEERRQGGSLVNNCPTLQNFRQLNDVPSPTGENSFFQDKKLSSTQNEDLDDNIEMQQIVVHQPLKDD